jgi:SAM-dependent methyltransferase
MTMWSRTHVEVDERRGGTLRIVGWSISPEGGSLREVRLRAWSAGSQDVRIESARRAASPDVAAAFPDCASASDARFEIVAEVREPGASGEVIALLPRFERGDGLPLVVTHGLPAIPERFFERIGPGAREGGEFLGQFLSLGLTERSRVLDVGCGVGRMALPLSRFLAPDSRYLGLDIDAEMLDWASGTIATHHPGFRFVRLDVGNGLYRPDAPPADQVEFPVDAGAFDFAYATSLFTHLQEKEARRYLEQIARALAPGATLLATFFVLDRLARDAIAAGRSACALVPFEGDAMVVDPKVPEAVIAFPREAILAWSERAGLAFVEERPGHWCGRARPYSFQDSLVFRRRA